MMVAKIDIILWPYQTQSYPIIALSNPIIAISNPRIRCCVIKPRLGLISALSGFDNGIYSYQTLLCYSLLNKIPIFL